MDRHSIFERTAYSLAGLSRAKYRYILLLRDDEEPLRAEGIRMASTPNPNTPNIAESTHVAAMI